LLISECVLRSFLKCNALAFLLFFFDVPPAPAEAPLLAAGEGLAIAAFEPSFSSRAFDAHGASMPAATWRQTGFSTYFEWGVSNDVTGIVTVSAGRAALGAEVPRAGLAPSQVGLRTMLAHFSNQALAIEGAVSTPAAPKPFADLIDAGRGVGWSADLIYFTNFKIGRAEAFASVRIGRRDAGSGGAKEWRSETTLGTRPAENWLVLLQAFETAGLDPAAAAIWSRPRDLKLQASLVRDFTRIWSVQVGVFATPWGREARLEHGIVLGLWRRFK
jgi:hypothetical protein